MAYVKALEALTWKIRSVFDLSETNLNFMLFQDKEESVVPALFLQNLQSFLQITCSRF